MRPEINTRKILAISATVFILIFIAASIYLLVPKAHLKFVTAPHQVYILVDNKDERSVNNGDSIFITPGKHTITVFRDEFNPYIKDIDIKNGETLDFVAALTGLTDNAISLLHNQESSDVIDRFNDAAMANQTDFISNIYPIMNVLPIQARLYSVYSCPSVKYPNDPVKIALCINASQDGLLPDVKNDIIWRSYNPDDYEIIYSVDASLTQ